MNANRLGRGLEALIRPVDELESGQRPGVFEIPLENIVPNPHQPRKDFDNEMLEELAASIKEKGLLTPITVHALNDHYVLIAGERRWRAAKRVGLKKIPGYVVEPKSDSDMMEMALIENIQRENLNSIEEAEGYAFLNSRFGLQQEKIAQAVGKKRVTISNALRLLNLPSEIKESLRQGEITAGHGRAILMTKTTRGRLKLWKSIIHDGLSVRQAEALASDNPELKAKKANAKAPSAQFRNLEDQLISTLGTKVKIKGSRGKGTIEISYYSDDDLERIIDIIQSS